MSYLAIQDWSTLAGEYVLIRQHGSAIDAGKVDLAAEDGTVLWLESNGAASRRLYRKADQYEVWKNSNAPTYSADM